MDVVLSTPIVIQVACDASSTVLTPPANTVYTVEMVDGQDTSMSFPKFSTTEPHCPISYVLTPSAGNTFMDTTVYNTNQPGANTVSLLPGRQGIKHQYKFTITATALGGATVPSPEWTMDVVCGPLSLVSSSVSVATSLGST